MTRVHKWSAHEIARLMRLRDAEHLTWRQIGARLGHDPRICCVRYWYECRRRARGMPTAPSPADLLLARLLAERDRCADELCRRDARDSTAAFFGDPLPERSALHAWRQRQNAARVEGRARGRSLPIPVSVASLRSLLPRIEEED